MRRSWPLTLSVMSRSTAPAAEARWPLTVAVRNKYAEPEATAPVAITPLMKLRRDVDCGCSSDIFLSSIAGSPRRTEGSGRKERIYRVEDSPGCVFVQRSNAVRNYCHHLSR